MKRRVSKTATAFASLVFAAFGSIGLANYFAKTSEPQMMGMRISEIENQLPDRFDFEETNSNITFQKKATATMGKMAIVGEYVETKGRTLNFNQPGKRVLNRRNP